jgi:hypothetical protein
VIPRELSDLAQAEIEQLRAEGYTLTDADVVRINALCWEIETPSARVSLARGTPVQLGAIWLWPFTCAGAHWFDAHGCNMPDPEAALAYALAHGRTEIETATWGNVRKWRNALPVTRQEMLIATAECLRADAKDELPQSKNANTHTTAGQLAMMMQALHGGDIDQWERRVSIGYICDLLTTAAAQGAADGRKGEVIKARANAVLCAAIDEIKQRCADGN